MLDPPSQQGQQPSAYPVPSSQQGLINVTVTTTERWFDSVSGVLRQHIAVALITSCHHLLCTRLLARCNHAMLFPGVMGAGSQRP